MSEPRWRPYAAIMHRSLPRLLSLLDRDPFSPTLGCFDRPYWHYKTVVDFPSATYQQGLLPLALLYRNELPENPCYGRPWALGAVCAAMRFWTQLQNRDGSFNEWYPGEHSHVATAFTAYAVSEALLTLGDEVPAADRNPALDALLRAARWLTRNVDRRVINHSAGALAALYNVHLLAPERGILTGVRRYVDVLREGQDEEGWFCEYGGADVGYQGVTLDYLAKYHDRSRDPEVVGLIDRGLAFFARFVYPDGTCGGPIGSRSTRYVLPHGLEILNQRWPQASDILALLARGLSRGTAIGPEQVDDRYFTFFFFPNLVQACVVAAGNPGEEATQDTAGPAAAGLPEGFSLDHFPNSGLLAAGNRHYQIRANLKKGGVMGIHAGGTPIYSDAGYFGELTGGRVVGTNWLNPDTKVERLRDGAVSLQTRFVLMDYRYPLKRFLIPFRLFNATVGRSGRLMQVFNRVIKFLLVFPRRVAPIALVRSIRFSSREVSIRDDIRVMNNVRLQRLVRLADAATGHVPTSRYWTRHGDPAGSIEADRAEPTDASSPIRWETRIAVTAHEASIEVLCNGRRTFHKTERIHPDP